MTTDIGLPEASGIPETARRKPGPKPGQARLTKKNHHDHPRPPIDIDSLSVVDLSYAGFLHSDRAHWVRRYQSLSLPETLFELGQLRRISEIAAESANRRTVPDETKCWICHTPHPAHFKWAMIYPERDTPTGTTINRFIDTIGCVQEHQLRIAKAKAVEGQTPIKGLPDRGMVKGEGS